MFNEKVTYYTELPRSKIVQKLKNEVAPYTKGIQTEWKIGTIHPPFTGKVDTNHFKIWKTPRHHIVNKVHISSAIAEGNISYGTSETIIQVEIQIAPDDVIFVVVLSSLFFLFGLYMISDIFWKPFKLMSGLMLILPFVISCPALFSFAYSCQLDKNKLKEDLKHLFEAEIDNDITN